MKRLIECVPNFSEGRDPAKVQAIVGAMSSVPGVYMLDREMDADHHRSVITLAGEPEAVAEAALKRLKLSPILDTLPDRLVLARQQKMAHRTCFCSSSPTRSAGATAVRR